MSFFQNFNTHSLRSTRGFKLKSPSPDSSPVPAMAAHLLPLPNLTSQESPVFNQASPFQTKQSGNGAQNITSHKDIRNYAEQTLGSDNALIKAVKLPKDEDVNEWLAVHVVDFYNQINMLYGTITEFCSPQTCPRMIATEEYEYLWQDTSAMGIGGITLKKPVSLPACEYVENLMNWIQNFFDNDNIFPSKIGAPFPQQFPSLVKTIFKRLLRIYAHIYCHHFHEISELGLQSHLNTSLKHYVLFSNEFELISRRDYGPLEDLIQTMLKI
ncbi:hypothetical protein METBISCDRAFT_12964 [Metschnikowia bicuspidata]|uniref:Mob1/phocein n=1 Tax=Metschnikowia bicuspidata TaxID=27322 RepID=A0A4V1J3G1_9ASCO|nr:hypothetical protein METBISCDRAFT_12964 [Metschnikowia bicuspidata]